MSRRPPRPRSQLPAQAKPAPVTPAPGDPGHSRSFWTPPRLALAVVALLAVHWSLAVRSLLGENPTVDEVAHLPAGITYWQTGSFRLYPHNPPLVKLVTALPVLWAEPVTAPLYRNLSWRHNPPVHASIAHEFAVLNAPRYFELFQRGRLVMPWFSVLGGVFVFAWSRRLYGAGGGLLSLALWSVCPNVLAHARLVTTDVAATALGVGATYLFWRCLHRPSWAWAAAAGVALGLAALTKFSALLLFALWPLLWLVHELAHPERAGRARRLLRSLGQGVVIALTSVLVINLGYGFEGTGQPLGRFEFTCGLLTRPRVPALGRPAQADDLLDYVRPFRVNRFRGSTIGSMPVPLPWYFLVGFDDQKLEAEGVPVRFLDPDAPAEAWTGYPVYLDGTLRRSGWWYYYVLALAYKVPEGTWLLGLLSVVVLVTSPRARAPWADEVAVGAMPVVVLAAMSFGTDINLGLRYILPAFPYAFIAMGKLAPWAAGQGGWRRSAAAGVVGGALAMTAAAAL
ncbi:MAG TPA: glycosyltransferase family 39 protein, partial [Isosphaeraceae bacterium]